MQYESELWTFFQRYARYVPPEALLEFSKAAARLVMSGAGVIAPPVSTNAGDFASVDVHAAFARDVSAQVEKMFKEHFGGQGALAFVCGQVKPEKGQPTRGAVFAHAVGDFQHAAAAFVLQEAQDAFLVRGMDLRAEKVTHA